MVGFLKDIMELIGTKMLRDHDDETNVLEAVRKLNDVKGVKGIRRYFKQVGN